MKRTLFALIAVLAVSTCAPARSQPMQKPQAPAPRAQQGERVLESFNVGQNVYVRALTVETKTSTLWVGTSVGVNEVDVDTGKLRNTYTRKDGLANEYVFAVGIDSRGYKWFGTNAGGASRFKDGRWKTYFPMHGLADYWIYAFRNDRKGDLWIGTWAGVSHLDQKTGKIRNYVKELINEWVYGIDMDRSGRMWFGTEGGVSMFDGKSWKSWTHKDGLGGPNADSLPPSPNTGLGTRTRHDLAVSASGVATYNPNYTFSMLVDRDDRVWAGTWGGGVSRFEGKGWSNLMVKDGLAGNIVYSMVQDARGIYWFGTSGGVSRYDGKTFRNFGRAEGLLENHVYALAVAPNGDIWAGTKHGVARIGGRASQGDK